MQRQAGGGKALWGKKGLSMLSLEVVGMCKVEAGLLEVGFPWDCLRDHIWLTPVDPELEMRTKVREPSRHYPRSDSFGRLLYRF